MALTEHSSTSKQSASQSYSVSRQHILEKYAQIISGSSTGLFVALTSEPLSDAAKNALTKTAESFNYGADPVTYVDVSGLEKFDNRGPKNRDETNKAASTNDQLFEIVEGLDPVCLVTCDDKATHLLTEAYRTQIMPMEPARVFGRSAAPLNNIDTMLETQKGKAHLWKVLRTLPHFRAN